MIAGWVFVDRNQGTLAGDKMDGDFQPGAFPEELAIALFDQKKP